MTESSFHPPLTLRNPHVQSVLASVGPRRAVARRRGRALVPTLRQYLVDCGDGVRLLGLYNAPEGEPRGLVLLLHGWEGCADSSYMVCKTRRLVREGYAVFRLNFRDHGPTHHLNEGIFHSCRLDEVVAAARRVAELISVRPMFVAGYSLGGNFALRVAREAPSAGVPVSRAVAVCPVVSPARGLMAMERGVRFYEHYFVKKWRRSLRRKQALFPQTYDFSRCLKLPSVRAMTQWLVEQHSEFDTIEDYLEGYSIVGDHLANLTVPASVLTAADDPIIPVEDFHALQLPEGSELEIARHGGHCGFIENWRFQSWAETFLAERLNGATASLPRTQTSIQDTKHVE